MAKTSLAVVCAFLLSAGIANCADSPFTDGGLYRAYFSPEYLQAHRMDPNAQYIIRIDGRTTATTNWFMVEFPQAPNQSYTRSLAGKHWINMDYVMELRPYTPPPGQ